MLAALVLASRVPFIGAGYGGDTDSWLLALSARSIATEGGYTASRLPGYPAVEFTSSLIWQWGHPALNLATAAMSAAAALFFALIMARLGCRLYLPAGLAFAFVPTISINSSLTMDYLWAMAFLLASTYFAMRGNSLAAGILLGLAVGCRITSGGMIVPIGILVALGAAKQERMGRLSKFVVATLAVSLLLYLPAFLTYGFGFFSFYKQDYPGLFSLLKFATEDLWGVIGVAAIGLAVLHRVWTALMRRKRVEPAAETDRGMLFASLMAVLIYLPAFLTTPYEPEYLMPIVPFALVLLSMFAGRGAFAAVCVALLFSPFVFSVGRIDTSEAMPPNQWRSPYYVEIGLGSQKYHLDLAGPVVVDYNRRLRAVAHVESLLRQGESLPEKSVVVIGRWLVPAMSMRAYELTGDEGILSRFLKKWGGGESTAELPLHTGLRYVRGLDTEGFETYKAEGWRIYYSADFRLKNEQAFGLDLRGAGAEPLYSESNAEAGR